MHHYILIISALLIGAITSLYMPMISSSSKILGSHLAGNIPFFAIALITSLVLLAFFGEFKSLSSANKIPLHYYSAGVLSALMILSMSLLLPALGIRKFIILVIAGQLIMSLVAGHYAIFGLTQDTITFKKILGALFLILGVLFTVNE